MIRIQARHIQVPTNEMAQEVMQKWQNGAEFADLAATYSDCPTSRQGGHLGEFGPGHMPAELDPVFLQGDIGCVYGPVETERGFHLLEVIKRMET